MTQIVGLNTALLIAAGCMAGGCLTLALVPPFPVFVLALALVGYSGGLFNAAITSFIAHDENEGTMALLWAMFGVSLRCMLQSGTCTEHWNRSAP